MSITAPAALGTPGVNRFSPAQLLRTAQLFASDPGLPDLLDLTSGERQWVELDSTDHLQIWLISWPAGTGTGWHDHGQSSGAFLTIRGQLREQTWSRGRSLDRSLRSGQGRTFDPHHVHHVTNVGLQPALSIHLYSPRLMSMTRYAVTAEGLLVKGTELAGVHW